MSKNKGTLISTTIRPLSTTSDFAVAYSNELLGGYHVVDNYTQRDNIPYLRRQFGMMVYVSSTEEFYQLKQVSSFDVADNTNWQLASFNISSTSNSEWVNSVISRSGTPPILPSIGDRYLVVSGTGAWTGFDDSIVEWDGTSWVTQIPSQGTSVRVDDEIESIYVYLGADFNFGVWTRQDFQEYKIKYEIESPENISIGTGSQYLIYGDLQLDGTIDTWGQLVVLNGNINGSGTVSIYGSGSVIQADFLTEIYGATGIMISASGPSQRIISTDIISGTGINISYSGFQMEISAISATNSKGYPKYYILPGETITVPDYEEYYIYGDLTVYGTLDIGTYGKVVVTNGAFVAATGSLVYNMGNVEVYDLLTISDNNIKIDITELKYGKANRVLFESDLVYVPLMGTYARVVTESDNFVYSTSSAYSTSTSSTGFQNYLGIGTTDPLKKLHVKNSGILIDGVESEQTFSLGDTNYARFVIDTDSSNTQHFLNLRNDQGTVLNVSGSIESGIRFPSLSIGTTSNTSVLTINDYYNNNLLNLTRSGTFSQINQNNNFQFLNCEVINLFGLTTSFVGSLWTDGLVTRAVGVADNSAYGGATGSIIVYQDNSNLILNEVNANENGVSAFVSDFSSSITNDLTISTSSISINYNLTHSVLVDAIGIYLSNVPIYANDTAAVVGGLTSGYLYATTSSGVTTLCIVP